MENTVLRRDELDTKLDEFGRLIVKDFKPNVDELRNVYDQKQLMQLRTQLGDAADESDELYNIIDNADVLDGVRIITTGRSRPESLFETHRFDDCFEAVEVLSNSTELVPYDAIENIRHWNPPSEKTATRYAHDFQLTGEALFEVSDQLREFEENDELAEIVIPLRNRINSIIPDLEDASGLFAQLVSHRDEIRSTKRAVLSLYDKARKSDNDNGESSITKKVERLLDIVRNAINSQPDVVYRSKKKLLAAQKSWNGLIRATFMPTLQTIYDDITSLNELTRDNINGATQRVNVLQKTIADREQELDASGSNMEPFENAISMMRSIDQTRRDIIA